MIAPGAAAFLAAGLLALVAGGGCQGGERSRTVLRPGTPEGALPMPTKDEIAIVDGVPITLTAFERVRSSLGGAPVETVYWVTISAAVLKADADRRARKLSIREAVAVARYAVGRPEGEEVVRVAREYFAGNSDNNAPEPVTPATVKTSLERLVAAADIKKNAPILSNLKYK